jgi:hypothetical protein
MSKRELAASVFAGFRLDLATRRFRERLSRHVPILAYHRVRDCVPGFPFDLELISATADGFRSQMDYVARHYTAINLGSLVSYLDDGGNHL